MTLPVVVLRGPLYWGLPPYFCHIHHSEDFPNLFVLENKHLCLEHKTKNKLKCKVISYII